MKIALFSPYGALSQETGLLYVLGNYARRFSPDIVQVRCNGIFSMCDRDAERGWTRSMSTCFRCIGEQRDLARWSGAGVAELSRYLTPLDIESTKRWIVGVPTEQLPWASFDGQNFYALALGSWQNRFDVSRPDLANPLHEQTLRRFMLSASRAYRAAGAFLEQESPNVTFVAGGEDFLSRAFVAQARALKFDAVVCAWDVARRAVMVSHPRREETVPCGLLLDGLVDMRSDAATWSPDLIRILDELLAFLDITEPQRAVSAGG